MIKTDYLKKITIFFALLLLTIFSKSVFADQDLSSKLSGRILLQVESNGQAWYINPSDSKKYYLGRPADAFGLMRNLGIGIINKDLSKIPIGLMNYDDADFDNDGLANRLETALGTNPENADSDNDGYDDRMEIENNYNPLDTDSSQIEEAFATHNLGKIFLQVEKNGEAWYVNPKDKKRYYLGRPADAFLIMSSLGLGITNENINTITTGVFEKKIEDISNGKKDNIKTDPPDNTENDSQNYNTDSIISGAASAIRTGNKTLAYSYFIPEMKNAIEYTIDFLDNEGQLTLGNILSGAKLTSANNDEMVYSTEVYFSLGGYKVPVKFHLKKQADEKWLLANL